MFKNKVAASLVVLAAINLLAFQNCAAFKGMQSSLLGSASVGSSNRQNVQVVAPNLISTNYIGPANKSGVGDQSLSPATGYGFIRQIHPGLKGYNFYWSMLESSGVAASASPVTCPSGYQMIPASENDRISLGYHHYHCISSATLAQFDAFFTADAAAGIQSDVVMWSAPAMYRQVGCSGMDWAGGRMYDGCVPRDDAMDDFEDYANLLASRYNGGSRGKIFHFVVWNEANSGGWNDNSPATPNVGPLSDAQVDQWVTKYTNMMTRVHQALVRHSHGVMMYASTDGIWANPTVGAAESSHIGSAQLLQRIWDKIGTRLSWSVVVHPYGDVANAVPAGMYTFNNLQMVVDFQQSHLRALGITNVDDYPQSYLLANEQLPFDVGNSDINYRANRICLAHSIINQNKYVIGNSDNHFFGSDEYAIIPASSAGANAESAAQVATGAAFASFDPAVWNQTNTNWCCQNAQVGCLNSNSSPANPAPSSPSSPPSTSTAAEQLTGTVDGISTTASGSVLGGWACSVGKDAALQVHLYIGGPAGVGTFLGIFTANVANEASVAQACGSSSAHRFQIPLQAAWLSTYASQSIYVHEISVSGSTTAVVPKSGTYNFPGAIQYTSAKSNNELWPATNILNSDATGSCYSSQAFANSANSSSTFLATWISTLSSVKGVDIKARIVNGQAIAFPPRYHLFTTDLTNSKWVDQGLFVVQPGGDGIAHVGLVAPTQTLGLMMVPEQIGKDDQGSYYFQVCSIKLN